MQKAAARKLTLWQDPGNGYQLKFKDAWCNLDIRTRWRYPALSASKTAFPTSPGALCHVPKPRSGILAPVLRTAFLPSDIVEVLKFALRGRRDKSCICLAEKIAIVGQMLCTYTVLRPRRTATSRFALEGFAPVVGCYDPVCCMYDDVGFLESFEVRLPGAPGDK